MWVYRCVAASCGLAREFVSVSVLLRGGARVSCRCKGMQGARVRARAAVCGSAASAVAALLSSAATMKNYPEAG